MRSKSETPIAPAAPRPRGPAAPWALDAMRRAWEPATAEVGATDANPAVGRVLLDEDGAIVATGVHRGPGTTTAVTLEPRGDQGRTGPCSKTLRARHDAILVGSGTWRSDNPRLDLHHRSGPDRQ